MQVTKLKRINAIQIEIKDTKIVWFLDMLSTASELEAMIPESTNIVLVNRAEAFTDAEQVDEWDLASQRIKMHKNAILIFSAGEYRVLDIHLKGSSLDSSIHYVLETPEGTIGLFAAEPSDSFIKQYSPIDVVIGRDMALAGVQIDLEPFYVVLTTLTDEYKKKSGLSEVNSVEKVSIKRIEPAAREGTVSMNVYALE